MRYAVVIEKAGENYSAYVPDLPGCIATAATVEEIEAEIRDAIRFHIEGLREDGLPVPRSNTLVRIVDPNLIEEPLGQHEVIDVSYIVESIGRRRLQLA